jgi:hypothetical protein
MPQAAQLSFWLMANVIVTVTDNSCSPAAMGSGVWSAILASISKR